MLSRSYWRFANLPTKKVDSMLTAIEPSLSLVELAGLCHSEDHHRLLWFALDVLPNTKIPALRERTWPAFIEWAEGCYRAAGARLRLHCPLFFGFQGFCQHAGPSPAPPAHVRQVHTDKTQRD